MRTIAALVAALAVADLAMAAPPTIPPQYRGWWCKGPAYFLRKKYTDRYYPDSAVCFRVAANRVEMEDGTAVLVSVRPDRGGHILKFAGHDAEGTAWPSPRVERWVLTEGSGSTRERRMSFGWRLYIEYPDEQPQQPLIIQDGPSLPAPPSPLPAWCESATSCAGIPMRPPDTSPKPGR